MFPGQLKARLKDKLHIIYMRFEFKINLKTPM